MWKWEMPDSLTRSNLESILTSKSTWKLLVAFCKWEFLLGINLHAEQAVSLYNLFFLDKWVQIYY